DGFTQGRHAVLLAQNVHDVAAADRVEPRTDMLFDFSSGLPAEAEEGFLDDVLAAMVVHEQTADVGQQRSFKPPGRRDHPFVVRPHARSFASDSYNGPAGDFLREKRFIRRAERRKPPDGDILSPPAQKPSRHFSFVEPIRAYLRRPGYDGR